jgi:PadR family transcriptional regulator PadR
MKAEALKGHLDGLLLAVIDDSPAHGYAIIAELRRRSGGAFALPEGTVYPALHRLERERLIHSRWSTQGGRRRRVYQLTDRGRRALADRRRDWRDFATAVAAVMERGPWPSAA